MTHRDRAGDPPGRRGAAGDAGQRQGFPTPSGGSPARPEAASPMLLDWGFRAASRAARDARIFRIYDGTSEIHRTVVARGLLKHGAALFDPLD